jgi:dipeptidyl aminopeptidase/acylaminoacyl peptidase
VGFEEGKRYPLVVHIHGGPAWLWSDRFMADWHDWAQLLAQRGYAVLLTNPRGSTGRGPAFVDAEVNDLGGGELRDMLTGLDHVLSMGFVDPERLGVGGWSHGGYMTAWTVTQTDRFKCAVMGAGLSNLASDQGQNDIPRCNDDYWDVSAYEDATPYLQRSAVTFMKNAKTPTLILHGEKDERVRVPQAWEMHRGLQWVGVETDLVTYPREQHPIRERAHQIDLLERVLSWYGRFLCPDGNQGSAT